MAERSIHGFSTDEIKNLLVSDIPVDRMSAMGYLLEDDQPLDDFVDLIVPLKQSETLGVFGMTEGDIAALLLAAKEVEPYNGTNQIVLHQLELIS
ncbi:MAG: hypothetical protein IKE43_10585 [Coriobacteriales bacterium]|nr:hypothetical protein [Coriobacteriales bacterium]